MRNFLSGLFLITITGLSKWSWAQELPDNPNELRKAQVLISIATRDPRIPSKKAVDDLEIALLRDGRVGSIKNWERRYSFALGQDFRIDDSKIEFRLRQLKNGEKSTRKRLTYGAFPVVDDNDWRVIDGYYTLEDGNIKIDYDGPNARH